MATKVTIQDIANELQLSRNTVSKAINNTGVLADATREKILRKAAEMGYKQFAYLPLFQEDAAKAAEHSILPSDKREIAMLTTQFLSSSHFSSMMLDRFQSEIDHLHSCTTIHRISQAPPPPQLPQSAPSSAACKTIAIPINLSFSLLPPPFLQLSKRVPFDSVDNLAK